MAYTLAGYATVPDYIYGITREIWEDRGIGGKLDAYYAPNILLRAASGFTDSNQGVTTQTLQTLHQFPNRQLVGEDVIWKDTGGDSFLSSHRLTSVMRHTGDGILGAAQGKVVRSRIIADCWVQKGVVVEEWLVRDQAAFANCLGLTAKELAQSMVERERRQGQSVSFFTPAHDKPGAYKPTVDSDETIAWLTQGLQRLWHHKETSAIQSLYFHGAALHVPGGAVLYGHSDIDAFVIAYLASFPDASFRVESAHINRESEQPVRVALRWSLTGTHAGFGHFGEPTGKPVYVMGMSHFNISQQRIMAEYMVTDEVSIWKQIL
jgi:predicted ester cyclase